MTQHSLSGTGRLLQSLISRAGCSGRAGLGQGGGYGSGRTGFQLLNGTCSGNLGTKDTEAGSSSPGHSPNRGLLLGRKAREQTLDPSPLLV